MWVIILIMACNFLSHLTGSLGDNIHSLPRYTKNRVVIQTDRLEGFEGEFVDVPKESWAEVLPLLLSLKVTLDERELIAPHLVTDGMVLVNSSCL